MSLKYKIQNFDMVLNTINFTYNHTLKMVYGKTCNFYTDLTGLQLCS